MTPGNACSEAMSSAPASGGSLWAASRWEAAALASQSAALLGLLAHRLQKRPESVMYLSVAVELAVEAQSRPCAVMLSSHFGPCIHL